MTTDLSKFMVSSGLSDYVSSQELVVPEWKIINVSTPKISSDAVAKHRGAFMHMATNEIKNNINATILKFKRGSHYNTGVYPNTKLLCYTTNYFTPDMANPVSPKCREYGVSPTGGRTINGVCEKACWTTGPDGKKKKPECVEYVTLIIKDLDTGTLAQINLRGMNLYSNSPFKRFISHIMATGKELYCFSVKLGTTPGNKEFPNVSRSDQALLITFDDITFIPEWQDNATKVAELENSAIVSETEEVSQAKSTSTVDDDDLPY